MPEFSLTPEDVGERLDRYVTRQLPTHSRAYAQQLIDEQQILVDGRVTKPAITFAPAIGSASACRRLPVCPHSRFRSISSMKMSIC
jgi:hypothetical protein